MGKPKMTAYTIDFNPIMQLTDDQFYQLCRANPELKFERNAQGELIIMPPTGGETGKQNFELVIDFGIWNRQTRLGVGFDSSTCFKLPNGANRSPDLAWVIQERWDALSPEQRTKFPPICPDFVVELMSPSDRLKDIQDKMKEYIENGARLGWLIAPGMRRVEIYRPQQSVQVLEVPATLSGDEVLPGFILDLSSLW